MPLGSYKGPWARNATAGRACRVGIDAPHCHPCAAGSSGPQCAGGASSDHYLSDLLGRFPSGVRDSTQVPTAVATYRKALAAAQNHSVAIASIGITTNMRDLVLSERDEFSPLSGPELIGQKVKLIVWMDGGYNFVRATPSFRLSALSDARRLLQGCAGHDGDDWLGSDAACRGSAKLAVEGIPANVRQIFSSVGGEIMHVSPTTPASVAGSAFESACGDCAPGRAGTGWPTVRRRRTHAVSRKRTGPTARESQIIFCLARVAPAGTQSPCCWRSEARRRCIFRRQGRGVSRSIALRSV